jgi:hypothetical protein
MWHKIALAVLAYTAVATYLNHGKATGATGNLPNPIGNLVGFS